MAKNQIYEDLSEQINLLFSNILSKQQDINAVKGPDEKKHHLTSSILKEFGLLRGRGFFYDYVSSGRGHGPFTELVDGSVKYDLITGIGPNLLGHSHPLYIKSHLEAACSDSIMCGNLLPYREPYELSKLLIEKVKKTSLKHVWFAGSGSFANDSALKMIWQKHSPNYRLFAFEGAFAGRSIATQEITENAAYRVGMPENLQVDHVPHFDEKDPENSLKKTLKALEDLWDKNDEEYAGIMIELVQGEAGFIKGTKEFYEGIFSWAKQQKIAVWVDEIQTFGRTGELFAFQTYGLDQYVDVVTVGKALQACAVLFSDEYSPKPGLISGTFNGSLSALSAGHNIVHYLCEGNFFGPNGRIKQIEEKFISKLESLAGTSLRHCMSYVGGIGAMIAFEVGESNTEDTNKFLKKLFENGVIAFKAGTTTTRVRLLPPVTLLDEHIDEIIRIIEKTALQVFGN